MSFYNSTSQSEEFPLYPKIRQLALSGRSFWSMIAFLTLGLSSVVMLLLSMLWGVDTIDAAAPQMGEFFYLLNQDDPNRLLSWLTGAVDLFHQLRKNSALDPSAWAVLMIIFMILFFAHVRRFDKPVGESLLGVDKARDVVWGLLSRVGHFADICFPVLGKGQASTDFFAVGRVFFAPKAHMSRILKGKQSDGQQKTLEFFMVHECAHAVTRDNWANSVFVVVITLLAFMFFLSFGPLIGYGSIYMAITPAGPLLTLPLSLLIALPLYGAIFLSFRGMVVSYIKAREFFADEAAFRLVPHAIEPYGGEERLVRPAASSALSAGISRYERHMHANGFSLHARDLLVYFWGFALSVRTLFVMVAPKELCWTVLLYDGVALLVFLMLAWTLPRRPSDLKRKPATAWVLTFITVFAIEFCGLGLVGMIMMANRNIFSDFNAQLIGIPAFLLFIVFLAGCCVIGIRRLFGRSGSDGTPVVSAAPKGWTMRRFGMFLLAIPGYALRGLIIIVAGTFLCALPLTFFLRFDFISLGAMICAIMLALLLVGSSFLYLLYQGLFIRKWRLPVIGGLETMLFFCLMAMVFVVNSYALEGVRIKVMHSVPDLGKLIELFVAADWTVVLPFAVVSTVFYLLLRLLAFWSQSSLKQMDLRLAQESSR